MLHRAENGPGGLTHPIISERASYQTSENGKRTCMGSRVAHHARSPARPPAKGDRCSAIWPSHFLGQNGIGAMHAICPQAAGQKQRSIWPDSWGGAELNPTATSTTTAEYCQGCLLTVPTNECAVFKMHSDLLLFDLACEMMCRFVYRSDSPLHARTD